MANLSHLCIAYTWVMSVNLNSLKNLKRERKRKRFSLETIWSEVTLFNVFSLIEALCQPSWCRGEVYKSKLPGCFRKVHAVNRELKFVISTIRSTPEIQWISSPTVVATLILLCSCWARLLRSKSQRTSWLHLFYSHFRARAWLTYITDC